jgi:hypothetical protein
MQSPLAAQARQHTLFIEQVPAHIAVFDTEMRCLPVSRRFLSDMAFLFSTEVFPPAEVHWPFALGDIPKHAAALDALQGKG